MTEAPTSTTTTTRQEGPRTLADLAAYDRPGLESLFATGTVDQVPVGHTHGLGLAFPGTTTGRTLGRMMSAVGWRGKAFAPEGGRIRNVLGPSRFEALPGDVEIRPSTVDDQPSIVVDYSSTVARGRAVRDEIREVGPGLFLGRGFDGDEPGVFFGLSSGPSGAAETYYSGKVVVVTGAASGFGACLARDAARRGALVVAADVNRDGVAAVATEIVSRGGSAIARVLDVTSAEAFEALVAETEEELGPIDILFNNAGIVAGGEYRDVPVKKHRMVMDVNVSGVLNGVDAVYPRMVERGQGQIVNTASISGLLPTPLAAGYSASKFAVVGLSTSLRAEAADLGVQVNAICPGPMRTAFFETPTDGFNLDEINNAALFKRKADPQLCARRTLDAVAKNKPVIVVGVAGTKANWLAFRLFPTAIIAAEVPLMRSMRKLRTVADQPADLTGSTSAAATTTTGGSS